MLVGSSTDPAERRADVVADEVMRHIGSCHDLAGRPDSDHRATRPTAAAAATSIRVRRALSMPGRAGIGAAGGALDHSTADRIRRSSGRPLAPHIRSTMESAMAADLSAVRVHAGGEAARLSRSLNARAFTVGSNVFFGAGEYRPDERAGQRLLAHELAHAVDRAGPSDAAGVQRDLVQRFLAVPDKPTSLGDLKAAMSAVGESGNPLATDIEILQYLNRMSTSPDRTYGTAITTFKSAYSGGDVDETYVALEAVVDRANANFGRLQDDLDAARERYPKVHDLLQKELSKPGLYTPPGLQKAGTLIKSIRFASSDLAFVKALWDLRDWLKDENGMPQYDYTSWLAGVESGLVTTKTEEETETVAPGHTTLGAVVSVAPKGTTAGQRYTPDRTWGSHSYHVSVSFKNDGSRRAKSAKPNHTPLVIESMHVTFRRPGSTTEPRFWWKSSKTGELRFTETSGDSGIRDGMDTVATKAVEGVVGAVNCKVV